MGPMGRAQSLGRDLNCSASGLGFWGCIGFRDISYSAWPAEPKTRSSEKACEGLQPVNVFGIDVHFTFAKDGADCFEHSSNA